MKTSLPQIYLARHGETEWSLSGQHTGRTDIPLTEQGKRDAVLLGARLKSLSFERVYTSPLQRARKTCELAGCGALAQIDPDLAEWNYGVYEGRTSTDIRKEQPDWYAFRDGCPGGESIEELGARADRVVARLRETTSNAVVFSHGHFLRFVAARWLGLPAANAQLFFLTTAALSTLSYEHSLDHPVISLWNDVSHLTKE